MDSLLERLEGLALSPLEEAVSFRSVRRKTDRATKKRSRVLESKLTARLRPQRTKGGRVKSQTLFFETEGSSSGKTWIQKIRALTRPGSKSSKIWNMNVTMVCNCPAWKWGGSDHWALRENYLYGLPRSNRSFPKIRDPEHNHAVCKHLISVSQLIRDQGVRIDS